MGLISYAQNFEDVMLWRALKHVEIGFYIDVGANDPSQDSVTKAFYERGWRGINIEPVSQWYEKLIQERPRDINLQIAAGAQTGELLIYELPDTGLSTIDRAIAERHEAERGYQKIEHTVPVKTLTEICINLHTSPIHFLKIDVEGAEKQVLEGVDFSILRPWIVLVESTIPNSPIEDYESWEPILLTANYEYVYFDGLNRFYVAAEHPELKDSFKAPPNVFDDFVLSGEAPLCSHARNITQEALEQKFDNRLALSEQRLAQAEQTQTLLSEQIHQFQKEYKITQEALEQKFDNRLAQTEQKINEFYAYTEALNKQLIDITNSRSWRITKPLRLFGKFARWFVRGSIAWLTFSPSSRPRRVIKRILFNLKPKINAQPKLKKFLLKLLLPFPKIKDRFKKMDYGQSAANTNHNEPQINSNEIKAINTEIPELSPRAQKIYSDLKSAVEKKEK